jgi:hypothetical protein
MRKGVDTVAVCCHPENGFSKRFPQAFVGQVSAIGEDITRELGRVARDLEAQASPAFPRVVWIRKRSET